MTDPRDHPDSSRPGHGSDEPTPRAAPSNREISGTRSVPPIGHDHVTDVDERIDAVIRREFSPPAADRFIPSGADKGTAPATRLRSRPLIVARRLALAATVLLGIGATWYGVNQLVAPRSAPLPSVALDFDDIYDRLVDQGFRTIRGELPRREPIMTMNLPNAPMSIKLAPDRSDIDLLSVIPFTELPDGKGCVLALVEGEPVVMFVGSAELRYTLQSACASQLNLFTRRLGALMLYELTPRDEPRMLDLVIAAIPDFSTAPGNNHH